LGLFLLGLCALGLCPVGRPLPWPPQSKGAQAQSRYKRRECLRRAATPVAAAVEGGAGAVPLQEARVPP